MAAKEIKLPDGKIEGKIHVSSLVYHILDISQQIQMQKSVIWD